MNVLLKDADHLLYLFFYYTSSNKYQNCRLWVPNKNFTAEKEKKKRKKKHDKSRLLFMKILSAINKVNSLMDVFKLPPNNQPNKHRRLKESSSLILLTTTFAYISLFNRMFDEISLSKQVCSCLPVTCF